MRWISCGDYYTDAGVVLGFGAVWFCRSMPTLRRNMLSPSSGPLFPCLVTSALKMETACFSEALSSTYETTRSQNQNNTKITRIKLVFSSRAPTWNKIYWQFFEAVCQVKGFYSLAFFLRIAAEVLIHGELTFCSETYESYK
jgi:hypothetical protein